MILTCGLMAVAHQPLLLVFIIMTATFILEDVATVTTALIASHLAVDATTAVAALVAGIILGDLAVYGIANRAAHVPIVARFLNRDALKPVRDWMGQYALAVVLVARFTSGLRLPVFAAAGSLNIPFRAFSAVIVMSTLVWTPGLYWAAATLGSAGISHLGMFGWVLPAGLITTMAVAPRVVSHIVGRQLHMRGVA